MTLISSFRGPLRFLLGDREAAAVQFSDGVLDDGVRSAVLLQQAPAGAALTPDQTGITPDLTVSQFALLSFKTALLFVAPNPDHYVFRSRSFSETISGYRSLVRLLEERIHQLECGDLFQGWQSYYAFLAGVSGLPLEQIFCDMEVNAPFSTVTLSASGVTED